MIQNGVRLDPIAVLRRDGADEWELYHGRHRYFAHLALGLTEIAITVVSAPIRPDARRGQARW
jgi:ParB-like chromosome segregation protein Spo0J